MGIKHSSQASSGEKGSFIQVNQQVAWHGKIVRIVEIDEDQVCIWYYHPAEGQLKHWVNRRELLPF